MAQKRPVAPDTPIVAYPTPEVLDIVITVDVDSRLPGYKSLEYGTLYPDQTRFPGAKLISQSPLEDDRFVRRIYATDRVNQDSYNYAIKYSSGSPDHPIYIRTTVESREGYTPLADGAPDPVIPGAYLVDEEAAPADEELNSLYLKVTRVYETLPGPVVTSYETNEAGQKVTVTTQRKTSTDYTLPQATALKSALAEADGTGVVNEQIRTIPSLFARTQFSVERPDVLPQKFRALVPDVETTQLVEGTAALPTLQTGDISASEAQQTLFVKQTSRRSRTAPSYPVTIIESVLTPKGQVATVTSVLSSGAQTASSGAKIESSEVTDLGDGRTVKVTTEVPTLFPEPSFTKSKEDVTPQKFRATLSETTTETTVEGTAAMPTDAALTNAGAFSISEQQLTVERKRVQTRVRTASSGDGTTPTSLTGGKIFTTELGGGDAVVTEQYGSNADYTSGFGTVAAEKEALGDGKYVTRHVVLGTPPELTGQIYDEQLDLVVPFTQKVIDAQSEGVIAQIGETNRVEITPRDIHHSIQKDLDVEDFRGKILAEYWAVPAYVDVRLPDVLTSVEVIYAKAVSSGGATAAGRSWSVQVQGSITMSGEVRTTIVNGYNGPVPATRYVFFIDRHSYGGNVIKDRIFELTGSTVQDWPAIFTEPVTLTVAGGTATENKTKSVTLSSGGDDPGSTADSINYSGDARVGFVTIQPTLHGSIPVTKGADVEVVSTSGSGTTLTATAPTLTPAYSPSSISATSPPSFPTGDFIASIDTESYKYSLVRVTVLVAHITSVYTSKPAAAI